MLRVLQINCQDLFLYLDKDPSKSINEMTENEWQSLTHSLRGIKPLSKCIGLANTLLEANSDIIVMNEVGGNESLSNFNKIFLQDKYQVAIANGCSDRGIDTGFLVKRGIEFRIKGYSSIRISDEIVKFSRTVNKLTLLKKDVPVFNIFGTHLRSKRLGANDWFSTEIRYKEVKGLVELLKKNQSKTNLPYILAGDFNGNAQKEGRDFEFDPIYEDLNLIDIHDLKNSHNQDRYSHIHFMNKDINYNQLDYIFLSEKIQEKLVEAHRILYSKHHIVSLEEKLDQPSDHYPQLALLDISLN